MRAELEKDFSALCGGVNTKTYTVVLRAGGWEHIIPFSTAFVKNNIPFFIFDCKNV